MCAAEGWLRRRANGAHHPTHPQVRGAPRPGSLHPGHDVAPGVGDAEGAGVGQGDCHCAPCWPLRLAHAPVAPRASAAGPRQGPGPAPRVGQGQWRDWLPPRHLHYVHNAALRLMLTTRRGHWQGWGRKAATTPHATSPLPQGWGWGRGGAGPLQDVAATSTTHDAPASGVHTATHQRVHPSSSLYPQAVGL